MPPMAHLHRFCPPVLLLLCWGLLLMLLLPKPARRLLIRQLKNTVLGLHLDDADGERHRSVAQESAWR